MAKRFGRNQRRRAREQIAQHLTRVEQLESARALDAVLLRELTRSREELRAENQAAREIAGELSIIFPPQTRPREIPGEARDTVFHPGKMPLSSLEVSAMPVNEIHQMVRDPRIPLDVMLSRLKFDQLDGGVHYHVKFKGGHVAYAMDGKAWTGLKRKYGVAYMTREIARDLATLLAKQL